MTFDLDEAARLAGVMPGEFYELGRGVPRARPYPLKDVHEIAALAVLVRLGFPLVRISLVAAQLNEPDVWALGTVVITQAGRVVRSWGSRSSTPTGYVLNLADAALTVDQLLAAEGREQNDMTEADLLRAWTP